MHHAGPCRHLAFKQMRTDAARADAQDCLWRRAAVIQPDIEAKDRAVEIHGAGEVGNRDFDPEQNCSIVHCFSFYWVACAASMTQPP